MKVILLQDVKSLGKKGEIVNVSDGYARNFVLPKKLGVEANTSNMNDLKLQKANADKVAQEQLEAARELAALLETKEVVLKMKSERAAGPSVRSPRRKSQRRRRHSAVWNWIRRRSSCRKRSRRWASMK